MIRITKGDITIEADTQLEAEQALTFLRRVSRSDSPPPDPLGTAYLGDLEGENPAAAVAKMRPSLVAVPSQPSMIPVRKVLLEVYDVIKEFPEGITVQGIAELSGIRMSQLSGRITRLHQSGLIEHVGRTINWRATALARKAKLIAS